MKIVYTHHARQRMRERNVMPADVERVVNDPLLTYETKQNSTCYVGRASTGRELQVFLIPGSPPGGSVTVKSVAWRDGQT